MIDEYKQENDIALWWNLSTTLLVNGDIFLICCRRLQIILATYHTGPLPKVSHA